MTLAAEVEALSAAGPATDRAAAREAFEKELALSDELQRELEETAIVCEKLSALPPAEQGLDEKTRVNLREECLRNLRIVRR